MALTRDDILKALEAVIDPASGHNVVAQKMIAGLVLRDGHAGFSLEVPPERGAGAEPLRQACKDAVAALPGITSVTAVLTAHYSGPSHHHGPHGQGAPHRRAPVSPSLRGVPGVGAIVAVASGKGGVGKSTVAVNLALALAKTGLKTGLLDADVYGPSVPRLLGITHKPETDGKKLIPIDKYGIKAMSIGFLVAEDQAMIWRGPMVQSALTQMLNEVSWAPLDVLVLDMPPGTGDAQLTIAQRVPLKGSVIVSTPQDIALIDARKAVTMFRKTAIPILGVVENMSVFVCPGCGESHYIFGQGGARETAAKLEVPFLGEIPLVPRIRETSDAGTPIVVEAPESPETKAFLALAEKVAAAIAGAGREAPKIIME